MKMLSKDKQLKTYQEMRIGSQEIVGDKGQLPNVVIGEYLSAAWLMIWGMLRQTSAGVRKFMDTFVMKILFYWPARVLRPAFASSRWEKSSILFLVMFALGGVAGCLITYYVQAKVKTWWAWVIPVAIFLCLALFLLVKRLRAKYGKTKQAPWKEQTTKKSQ